MQKLTFPFKAFLITDQPNGTNHLILIVGSEMAASSIYPILAVSTNLCISYKVVNDYFDLFLNLYDSDSYFELNYNIDSTTELLAKAIDNHLVKELWVSYSVGTENCLYRTAIAISNK